MGLMGQRQISTVNSLSVNCAEATNAALYHDVEVMLQLYHNSFLAIAIVTFCYSYSYVLLLVCLFI